MVFAQVSFNEENLTEVQAEYDGPGAPNTAKANLKSDLCSFFMLYRYLCAQAIA